jgi:hypothetical protein
MCLLLVEVVAPMSSLTPEALYLHLRNLVAEMPDLAHGAITPETRKWLGRATALVELMGDQVETIKLHVVTENLTGPLHDRNAETITAVVHRALARAELKAPAAFHGSFIVAGNTFAAFAAVKKILGEARSDVLMVDPYADANAVTDYAALAPENVSVRLLGDQSPRKRKPALKPAVDRWVHDYGTTRPLEVRLAVADVHDRLIVVDGKTVWALGQSFNRLAEHAHTTLLRVPQEIAPEKIAAYETMWVAAVPLS